MRDSVSHRVLSIFPTDRKKTTYLVGLRRSWFDVLSIPLVAIANSQNEDEKMRFNYYFMDFNARVNHLFSPNANAFVSVYFGDDKLKTGTKEKGIDNKDACGDFWDEKYDMHWEIFWCRPV